MKIIQKKTLSFLTFVLLFLLFLSCGNKNQDETNEIDKKNKIFKRDIKTGIDNKKNKVLDSNKKEKNDLIIKNEKKINQKDNTLKNQKITKSNDSRNIKQTEKEKTSNITFEEISELKSDVDLNKDYIYIIDISSNNFFAINISKIETFNSLKHKIKEKFGIPINNQIFEINSEKICIKSRLSDYNIKNKDIIKLKQPFFEAIENKKKKLLEILSKNSDNNKKIVQSKIVKKGSAWQNISKGLNIAIKCPNSKCPSKDYIWIPLGFGKFYPSRLFYSLRSGINCTECNHDFEKDDNSPEIIGYAFYDCNYKREGELLIDKNGMPVSENLKRIVTEEITIKDIDKMNIYSRIKDKYWGHFEIIVNKNSKQEKKAIFIFDETSKKLFKFEISNKKRISFLRKEIKDKFGYDILTQVLECKSEDDPKEFKSKILLSRKKIKEYNLEDNYVLKLKNKSIVLKDKESDINKWPKLFEKEKKILSSSIFHNINKKSNKLISKTYKSNDIKPGVNIYGKCNKCKKEGFSNLGFDGTKYDKYTKHYSKKNAFDLHKIIHNIPCSNKNCNGKLDHKSISKFGAYKCLYRFELVSNLNGEDTNEQNYAKKFRYIEIKKMNSNPNLLIWSLCRLIVFESNEVKQNGVIKGLNLAVKCPNKNCPSYENYVWVPLGLDRFRIGSLIHSEFQCNVCNKINKYIDRQNNQNRILGFGFYDCKYLAANASYKKGKEKTRKIETNKNFMDIYAWPESKYTYINIYTLEK